MGNIKKTGLNLSSESVNMLIRGVVAAVRVVKNHSKSTLIVFLLYSQHFVSTPLSLLYASKVATELWIHDFTIFRTVIIFVLIFRHILIFGMRCNPTCSSWNVVFIGENCFALSIIVFEKIDVKFGYRVRPNFNIYAAVTVYSPTASSFALFWLIFLFMFYILSSTFQFK